MVVLALGLLVLSLYAFDLHQRITRIERDIKVLRR